MEFNLNSSSRDSMDPLPFNWTESDGEPNESAVRVTRSQLKRRTKFGVFLWWSDQIPTWVHPDDVQTAERLIPGYRVFKRCECENSSDRELGYSIFQYGQECFRGKPALWLEVQCHGFEIGDLIEIRSLFGKLSPQIAVITAILWNRNSLEIQYFVSVNGARVQRPYSIGEIRPAIRLGRHLSPRELRLATGRNSEAE